MTFEPFTITKVEKHSPEELIDRLRQVTMLKNRLAKPYALAKLEIMPLPYDLFRPAQRYVLADNLLKVQLLEWRLAEFGLHPLSLDGYLTLWTDRSPEPIDLLPPIVEAIPEANGSVISVINDGMHRLFSGRLEWRVPTVVMANGLPPEYPYYAYPIPGADPWDQVKILEGDFIPEGYIKKWHRTADNKKLYRDFNSAFQNVGGPRKSGAQ
ncbi:MAG: hypothetical protein LBU69_01580 [Deltaproteobacteria bacterium]|jgi:hypothetical protein|nr:hypothetical protein [Deltaproteobacteria bacterium]